MTLSAEVVAVGTELLLGQIVDSNGAWIGEQLASIGVDHYRATRIGDNHTRMVSALSEALGRADAVICCGGLGPTQDDVTREAIAAVMGVALRRDEEVAAVIRRLFESRSRNMTGNNLRQADVPEGATVIPQTRGTAPGLICPVGAKVIYAVPGVPHEMRDMLDRAVLPDLAARSGTRAVIASRVLRTWGESESALAERLDEHLRSLDRSRIATLAFQASGIEGLKVRITARGRSAEEAADVVAGQEAVVRELLGELVFGVDGETMEHAVAAALGHRTLAVAESVTGGLIASRLVAVPGASRWFLGGIVAYGREVKTDLLDVPDGPAVSAATARAMAAGVRRRLGSDVGLATTGVAGPESQDGEPVGTVLVGFDVEGDTEVRQLRLPGDRDQVRGFATITALDILRRRLHGTLGAG